MSVTTSVSQNFFQLNVASDRAESKALALEKIRPFAVWCGSRICVTPMRSIRRDGGRGVFAWLQRQSAGPFNPDPRKPSYRQGATGGRQGHQGLISESNPKKSFLVRWR
jgi:hypothetical protein